MITGGTGSFGSTVLKHFLESDLAEIRIFSRDEKKQDDMRHDLQAQHPDLAGKVKFYIGDVRNHHSIEDAIQGVNYIFHAAALKQVPSCEFFPQQAVMTNIQGSNRGFADENNAWVEQVVLPMLAEYEGVLSWRNGEVNLLVPLGESDLIQQLLYSQQPGN